MDWTRPQKLDCQIQHYAWGSQGPDAYLAKLKGIENPDQPMAELWMGAHPKCPSEIAGVGLDQLLKVSPLEILGKATHEAHPHQLPYLFKVLCAGDALSIQLHPNKSEAEELHAQDPEHYPDDNHKPEIAIALDRLEALLGFETFENIVINIESNHELKSFIGEESLLSLEKASSDDDSIRNVEVKRVFNGLFAKSLSDRDELKTLTASMAQRLCAQNDLSARDQWFVNLQKTYPEGDIGLFCLYFLNYRVLERGDGVFLKADVPHAYLKGNIIECMANSDNVVRAGLTPKFVDVENLAKIVLVECSPLVTQAAEDNGLGGECYRVPISEFEVHTWKAEQETLDVEMARLSGPRILVVTEGQVSASAEGESVVAQKGEVLLLADACSSSLRLSKGTEIFMARPAV